MGNCKVRHILYRAGLRVWSMLLVLGLWATATQAATPLRIDLTRAPWSAIEGFNAAYANGFSGQKSAKTFSEFPVWPLRIFNTATNSGIRQFSLETEFSVSSAELSSARSLALFLPNIGQSWNLYLNGHLLRDYVSKDPDHLLATRRTVRNEIVHLPHDWLLAGKNRLVFHLVGDSSVTTWAQNGSLGFNFSTGYRIGEFDELMPLKNEAAYISAIVVYLVLGALSLLLFSYRRREKPFLYFSVFTLLIFVYFGARSSYLFHWVLDTTWLTRLEYATLAASAPFAILFVHSFLHPAGTRIPLSIRVYAIYCGTLTLANLALPFHYNVIALRLWQWAVFPYLGYAIYMLGVASREQRSDAIKLAPGMLVFFVTVIWDVGNSLMTFHRIRLTQFGFFFFVFSIAVILANRFLQMHQDAERLNKALIDSEARLQSLFDATVEALCIHENNRLVDANPSFSKLFGVSVEEAKGRPVSDFFAPESRESLLREFTIAKRPYEARALLANGAQFTAELINKTIPYAGRPLSATSIRDITDRKNAEEKLLVRNEELENLSRIMVERELRMIGLKKELEVLRKKPKT